MDMLSVRYACPFLLLDEFIHLEQLHDFVFETMKTISEEKKEQYQWEFFLHKVFDKTYEEFLNQAEISESESDEMSDEKIKEVTDFSRNILDGFTE